MKTENSLIKVHGLRKSYGATTALAGVSFRVRKGEIFAYLGPNGAGKTTTINILCGLLQRDDGEVTIGGLDINREPVAVKQRIGVVHEQSNLYPELSCRRNLEYIAELFGLRRSSRRARTDFLLEVFDLSDRATSPIRALSRGMKHRLTVAAALIHSPEVVFLDEPTAGLDVPSTHALRSLIKEVNRDGTTVFLTTHNLMEAEGLSNRVLILVTGRVVAQGTAEEIRQRVIRSRTLAVRLSEDVKEESLRKSCPTIESASTEEGVWYLEVNDIHEAVGQVMSFAQKEDIRVLQIDTVTPGLEDAFMKILENNSVRGEKKP